MRNYLTSTTSPPKIKTIRIVDNPFDDIVPRITAEEKRAQALAKQQVQKEREEAARRKGAKKYVCSLIPYATHYIFRLFF